MRLLPLAIATVTLSLSLGVSAMACEFQQSKSNDVVSTSPLVERLVALAAKQGVEVKTQ
jgi:hypothetical protein